MVAYFCLIGNGAAPQRLEMTMAYFTSENTDGFTSAEIDILNRAHQALVEKHGADDALAQSIGDLLNNAWTAGATANDLFVAVDKRL